MSTLISSDAPLRPPIAEVHHAAPPAAQPVASGAKDESSVTDTPRYTSPVVKVDSGTGLALLVVRDGDTGREIEQYPSRQVVEEYKRNIPSVADQHPGQTKAAAPQQPVEDAKAPPAPVAAPVAAAPVSTPAPAQPSAPAPTGGSIKI